MEDKASHSNIPSRISYKLKGTGMSCKEKIRKENFQMFLSLSFNNYKIVFKVRIFSSSNLIS